MSFGPFNPMLSISANSPQDAADKPKVEKGAQQSQETEEVEPFTDVRVNNTLYLNHLNEKIPIDEMRDALFTMFMKFGKIVDVMVKKNLKMRGQAFIVFQELGNAI